MLGGKYDAVEKKGHHTIHFKEKKRHYSSHKPINKQVNCQCLRVPFLSLFMCAK